MVLVVGVEPTRCCHLRILSPVRLPFRHTSIFFVCVIFTFYTFKRSLFKNCDLSKVDCLWRYHPDLNRGIKVLQTFALPLGDGTIYGAEDGIRTRDICLGKATLYH